MEPQDREALRRRLYGPDASPADVTTYRTATVEGAGPEADDGTDAEEGPAAPEDAEDDRPVPARRSRGLRVAAVVCVVVALGAAAVAVGRLAPAPTPTSAAPTWAAAPRDPGDSMVAAAIPDQGRRPGATGSVLTDGGSRSEYLVAEGDTVAGVAARFDLCRADVLAAQRGGTATSALRPGELLRLERLTASREAGGSATC